MHIDFFFYICLIVNRIRNILLLIICSSNAAISQQNNFITNGSFEDIDSCYGNFSLIGEDVFQLIGCVGWSNPISSSSDHWCGNPKSNPPYVGTPELYQNPKSGQCMGGFSASVGVGCASGVDSLVRSAFPSASVFRVGSFAVGGRVSRASFALRSSALVSWCASSGGLLVAFPLGSCPVGVAVSSSFRGCGSGSWGSVALAVGLGCSVLVVAPAGFGSAWFGSLASRFRCVGSAPCGGSLWLASPVPVQLALF